MKKVLIEYIIRNKKNFIIISVLFCIGICIGTCSVNNSNEVQKQELNTYITDVIDKIKKAEDINKFELLALSIKENTSLILIIWFLGCTIIGGVFIYLAIIYKGFTIGYTISAMIAVLGTKEGLIISIISMFLQNIIFLFAFFLIAENGIKLYKGIYTRCINLKEEVIRHTIIMLITIMLSIFSSLVEVYISMNLLIFLKEFL